MITFYKLWDKMNRSGIRKKDLKDNGIVSSATINKLMKNEIVTTATLDKLCEFLDCELFDICEYEPNKKEESE